MAEMCHVPTVFMPSEPRVIRVLLEGFQAFVSATVCYDLHQRYVHKLLTLRHQ